MDPTAVPTLLGTWGYPALLALLLLTGVGSPIPEDLLLLTAGYLLYADVFQWPLTLGVCMAGVVASDVMLYSAGRHLAWRSEQQRERRLVSPSRLLRATRWFTRVGPRLIVIARLTPGTRAVVFVTAGLGGVSIWSFLRYDGLGAAIWVPAVLTVGHTAGPRVGDVQTLVDSFNRGAAWVLPAAAALLVLWLLMGREESKL